MIFRCTPEARVNNEKCDFLPANPPALNPALKYRNGSEQISDLERSSIMDRKRTDRALYNVIDYLLPYLVPTYMKNTSNLRIYLELDTQSKNNENSRWVGYTDM